VGSFRLVVVGTGTGVGKTHVACALVAAWGETTRVVGLKPIETGILASPGGRILEESDQARLSEAARLFHVKHHVESRERGRQAFGRVADGRGLEPLAERPAPVVDRRVSKGKRSFHVKHSSQVRGARGADRMWPPPSTRAFPQASLYAFPEPVSPHLAARDAGVRIDLGLIERWVVEHEAPVTVIETAGGLFSPLGHTSTNFELTRALRPDAVLLVASDKLGVLHDLTTTLALAAARGGLPLGVVLSAPAAPDASTGRNAHESEALGIGAAIATFPRRPMRHAATVAAARAVIAWADRLLLR
jgi:dethiobiotin synthetase